MSRIDDLLQQLTLEEKISMLAASDLWFSTPVPRLNIPYIHVADGPNGVRGQWSKMSPSSAATPVGTALGATWNPEIVEKIGNVLADEVKAKNANILLAPTVNIHRTPIAGRNFECFSEDPYLAGMLASAYIQGLQDKGVGACIKHFVGNDQEFERDSISSEIDERTLREIYLEPFRLAIRNSNPWTIMTGYNRVNGVYACENDHILKEVLKSEWKYEGAVVSDWYGTYDEGVPVGGLDIEFPGNARWMSAEVVQKALDNGSLSMDSLNDKVRRLLLVMEKAGLFNRQDLPPERAEDKLAHRKIIRQAAGEAIVLLKNGGNLPLKKIKSIAVIGPHSENPSIFGGGSSSGFYPHYIVSPFEGIKNRAGKKIKVDATPGCFIYRKLPAPAPETLSTADGRVGLNLSLFDGTEFAGAPLYQSVETIPSFDWFHNSIPNTNRENFSMRLEGFFTPRETGRHKLSLKGMGWCKLYLDNKLVVDHSSDEHLNKEIITDIKLKGEKSYALKLEYWFHGESRHRSVHIGHQPPITKDLMAEAVKLARKSDVVILVAGLNSEWESEGFDRVDMKLPGKQNELIEQVLNANKNTVVVLNVGSPVEMPWIDKTQTVLQLWYNSQEQGNALADVLFGDVNPSGKLPTTFPVRLVDNPGFINYPGENGKVRYGEGIFVGYRYYDKKDVKPLFPFGHGLSYTQFEYSNLRLSARKMKPDGRLKVKVDVINTGKVIGKEIVQLYVHDLNSTFARPEKELKAFAKVELKSKQKKTVTFTLDREAFWYFDTAINAWSTEAGEFEIQIGASSRDIRLKEKMELK
ncbi:MAG TPA: glycoside hydrolase family 3 C-terminal domain-containing protein [Anaerolineales bacterium]